MRIIDGKEVNTISEAWDILPVELKEHSLRVAEYSKIAFAKICTMDLYLGVPRAERELQKERTNNAYESGLYHDIGKLLLDEEPIIDEEVLAEDGKVPADHTIHGKELFLELYPNVNRMLVTDKNMILGGITEHHERMNGSGTPYGLVGDKISYVGKIVAIADMLDHIAMTITSENPIAEALKVMKPLVEQNVIDGDFFKAFTGNGAKLKKVFKRGAGDDAAALPTVDTFIRRRSNRPMSLVYKRGELKGRNVCYAEMRFKGNKGNDLKFEDVSKALRSGKLINHLAEYFTYELLDTLNRFRTCGIEMDAMVIYFPDAVMKTFGIANKVKQALLDEKISSDDMIIVYSNEIRNVKSLNDIGIEVITEVELDTYLVIKDDEFKDEEDIVAERIKQLKIERGEDSE